MSSPSIVTCLLGIYFFLAGCLQIALHVSTVPKDPFAPFLNGLMVASWPLAVAGIIFILVDIRMQISTAAHRKTTFLSPDDEEEYRIPEAPVQRKQRMDTQPQQQPEAGSYFHIAPTPEPQQVQPATTPAPAPVPQQQEPRPNFFPTPPPFQQTQSPVCAPAEATVPLDRHTPPAPAQQPQPQPTAPNQPQAQQKGLSFFKV